MTDRQTNFGLAANVRNFHTRMLQRRWLWLRYNGVTITRVKLPSSVL